MSKQNDPMAEIKASFFIECEELLEALQDGLQSLGEGENDSETINVVFRAVHSIKGGAGAFGLEGLVRFAHRYESVLDEVRSGRLTPGPEEVRLFFLACDHLSDLVTASRDERPLPTDESDALVAQLEAYLGNTAPQDEEATIDFQPTGLMLDLDFGDEGDDSAEELNRYAIRFTPEFELFETGNEPHLLLRALSALGEMTVTCDLTSLPDWSEFAPETPYLSWDIQLICEADLAEVQSVFEFADGLCKLSITHENETEFVLADLPPLDLPDASLDDEPVTNVVNTPEPAPAAPLVSEAKEPKAESGPSKQNAVVRVDLDRIERLVNLVGELVINQAMLSQSLEQANLSPHSDAMNGLEEFQRLTRDIQDSVMMIRAQPVKSLFQRMSRIVREASGAVGKDVRLVSEGESTEVDKTVIERLADPLTHMIRNAVDHGLEKTENRVAAGKAPQGIVRLSAAHRSGRVVIEVSDDGSGINRPKVLEIAKSKGLIPDDVVLTDTEIDNLLFLPGFSTASSVSDLSGRGVGMDVVKTAIQALGGRITITSVKDVGTTFSISLPLTLAVLDGMVVDIADETLVLPLSVVVETLTLQEDDFDMIRPGSYVVRVRGEFVPLFDLGVELGYRKPREDYVGAVVLLIAQEDGSRAAMIIDGIQDQRQVVIKGLNSSFHRAPGIAAATILGDGQIALILDPADVIANARGLTGVQIAMEKTGASA